MGNEIKPSDGQLVVRTCLAIVGKVYMRTRKRLLIGWRSVYWSFLLLTCQVAMSLVASRITIHSQALWEVSRLRWVGKTVLEARSENVLSSPSQFLGNTCVLWLLAPHSCYLHSSASAVTSLPHLWTSCLLIRILVIASDPLLYFRALFPSRGLPIPSPHLQSLFDQVKLHILRMHKSAKRIS